MNEYRLERLLTLVQAPHVDRALPVLVRICRACPEAMDIDGAGVSVLTPTSHRSLGASDDTAAAIESIQIEMREGPCIDVYHSSLPVLEPDLRSAVANERWPAFSHSALEFGAAAVFGFPLLIDHQSVGALDLYTREPRPLSASDVDDALILADMAALAIRSSARTERSAEIDLPTEPEQDWTYHAVVHHASGMTAVQLGISVDEALLRLRAHAFAADRAVADVAADIVMRRTRLEAWPHD